MCKLLPSKDVENSENAYNHNFKGLYCVCDKPYPDPNVEEQVEMIQCCICEDWLHEEHLGLTPGESVSSQSLPLCAILTYYFLAFGFSFSFLCDVNRFQGMRKESQSMRTSFVKSVPLFARFSHFIQINCGLLLK